MVKVGNRTFRNIHQWQVDYIREHYQEKFTEIADAIDVDYRRVGEIINLLGLKRERHWKIYLPKTAEVKEKLMNPFLSHVEIAKEYGVTETCVAKRRKELGVGIRKKNFQTLPEKEVAELLDILDIIYINPKQIGKWSVDFYLGCKYCIDVHGDYFHSKPKVIDRDKRKKDYLADNHFCYYRGRY
jgi:hypothetical protein